MLSAAKNNQIKTNLGTGIPNPCLIRLKERQTGSQIWFILFVSRRLNSPQREKTKPRQEQWLAKYKLKLHWKVRSVTWSLLDTRPAQVLCEIVLKYQNRKVSCFGHSLGTYYQTLSIVNWHQQAKLKKESLLRNFKLSEKKNTIKCRHDQWGSVFPQQQNSGYLKQIIQMERSLPVECLASWHQSPDQDLWPSDLFCGEIEEIVSFCEGRSHNFKPTNSWKASWLSWYFSIFETFNELYLWNFQSEESRLLTFPRHNALNTLTRYSSLIGC